MIRQLCRKSILGMLVVTVLAVPALADDARSDEQTAARLEALIASQQQRIDNLEQQAAAMSAQDQGTVRAEAMKQQIREVLSEAEFRESLMPSTLQAGYDDGFFIRSSDNNFLMKFFGRIQFRYTYYSTRSENHYLVPGFRRHDRSGFDAARVRFGVRGHAYTPDLTYCLELEADEADGYDFVLSGIEVNYHFCDEFQMTAGLMKLASMRSSMTSDANLQFVERPMVDAVFAAGYGIGLRFWGQLFDQRLTYYLDIANSMTNGEGAGAGATIRNDEVNQLDGNPAILFRTVYHVMGEDADTFACQADHNHCQEPGLDIGFHYAFNEDYQDAITSSIPYPRKTFFRSGGFGLTNSNGLQINQFGFDAAFKYMGFSATAEYVLRILDVRSAASAPYSPLFLATGDGSTNVQHGGYLQCGYFLPIPGMEDKFEVVGRVGGIAAVSSGSECAWEYAGGLNYYINGDNLKLQTDITYVDEAPISNSRYSLANVNDDALVFRVQLQLAF